jgi:hypothetical protein
MDDNVIFAVVLITYGAILALALYVRFVLGKDTQQARKNTDLLVMQLIKRTIVSGMEFIEPRKEEKPIEVPTEQPNPETKEHLKYAKDALGLGEFSEDDKS